MGTSDTLKSSDVMRKTDAADGFALAYVDDFSGYSPGQISDQQDAINEFHYRKPFAGRGPWTDISIHYSYPNHGVCWQIEEAGTSKLLVQPGHNREIRAGWKRWVKTRLLRRRIPRVVYYPSLVLGDPYPSRLMLGAALTVGSADGSSGLVWGMTHARSHYMLAIWGGRVLLGRRDGDWEEQLAVKRVVVDLRREHRLEALVEGRRVRCFLDGHEVITAAVPEQVAGRVGVFANVPTRFARFEVWTPLESGPRTSSEGPRPPRSPGILAGDDAPMALRGKIALPSSPSGRSLRFGSLGSEGQVDILIAQGTPLKDGDNYNALTCLTAINQDGQTLWQRGTPRHAEECLCSDLPVQIYDIDGDGCNEVICAIDFKLMILNGLTGEPKVAIETPESVGPCDAFPRILGDAIYICNLSGSPRPSELILKDRHSKVWAYDSRLNLLWSYHHKHGELGHVPFARDLDGDGRDELIVGSVTLDSTGRPQWDLRLGDHVDAGVVLPSSTPHSEPQVALAASDEGLVFCGVRGRIGGHQKLGHVQTIVCARLVPDHPEWQIATVTYWGNPGVIYILDQTGQPLRAFQPSSFGSPLCPVNWFGDGSALLLLTAAIDQAGGLYDGLGRQLVAFPDDGHPSLCSDAIDLDGDGYDELLCWDHRELWIYGRSLGCPPSQARLQRYPPLYNESNYGGRILLPAV